MEEITTTLGTSSSVILSIASHIALVFFIYCQYEKYCVRKDLIKQLFVLLLFLVAGINYYKMEKKGKFCTKVITGPPS